MMKEQEIDALLNDFLQDTPIDGEELFIQQVMSSLPPSPSLFWWKDMMVASVGFTILMGMWYFKLLSPHLWISLTKQGVHEFAMHFQGDVFSGVNILVLALLGACYYLYDQALTDEFL